MFSVEECTFSEILYGGVLGYKMSAWRSRFVLLRCCRDSRPEPRAQNLQKTCTASGWNSSTRYDHYHDFHHTASCNLQHCIEWQNSAFKGITEVGSVGWLLGRSEHGSFIHIAWNSRPRRSCTLSATATGRQCRLCVIAWAQQRPFNIWERELSNSFETAWMSNLSHRTLPLNTVHIKRK
ncbi:hypothetical protein BDR22DRAFT_544314 [Usnea florida]